MGFRLPGQGAGRTGDIERFPWVRVLAIPDGYDVKSGVRTLRSGTIKEVIFGAEMPNSQRDSLKSVLEGCEVSFYEAIFSPNHLGVDIVQVAGD